MASAAKAELNSCLEMNHQPASIRRRVGLVGPGCWRRDSLLGVYETEMPAGCHGGTIWAVAAEYVSGAAWGENVTHWL